MTARIDVDVLVAGAGPTGLMLALALARGGARVRVVDRLDGPSVATKALGVQARTLELYDRIGIATDAVALGRKAVAARMWAGGRTLARVPLGDIGHDLSPFPYLLVLGQDDNERLLGAALRAAGVEIEWGTELVGFEQDAKRVVARLKRCGRDGGDRHDALARRLRRRAQRGAAARRHRLPRRAVRTRVLRRRRDRARADGGRRTQRVPARGRLPAACSRCAATRTGASSASCRPRCARGATWPSTTCAPRSRRTSAIASSWTAARGSPPTGSTIGARNGSASGRIFLLGDAAHIHSPVGAQGMNTGLQDAANLGWKLARVVRGEAPEALVDSYALEREPVAQRLLATTDRAFAFVVSDAKGAALLRTRVVPRILAFAMRFRAVREFAFRTIAQIGIRYRGSPLSLTEVGWPRGAPAAGDRFPWVRVALDPGGTPVDLYSRLDAERFTWIVFGDAPAGVLPPALAAAIDTVVVPPLPANAPALARARIAPPMAFLVRPDGYIALATRRADVEALANAWRGRFGLA